MQLKPEQLLPQLKQGLPAIVWIAGDETLLVQESCDAVRKLAKEQGFLEREVYTAQAGFDWSALLESGNSLSLFAEKKLIDLHLNTGKPDRDAQKALQQYLANPSEDNLLLISGPRLDKASTKAKWFSQLERHICFVPVWPITPQQLPGWVRSRLQGLDLKADDQAIQILCQRTEGNLLATAQEIEKLSILAETRDLDAQTVARAVADSSRFNAFSLIDAAEEGHAARALNILYHLRAEGEDSLKILNLLAREIRLLRDMAARIENGASISAAMQHGRVWRNRMNPVSTALNNHDSLSLARLLDRAAGIDQSVKGLKQLNPWDELAGLVMAIAAENLPLSA